MQYRIVHLACLALIVLLSACGNNSGPTAIAPTAAVTNLPAISSPTTAPTIEPTIPLTTAPTTTAPTIEPTIPPTAAPTSLATTVPVEVTAMPTANAIAIEPVPLTIEGLTPLLIQAGDLPDGWTGGKLYEESPVDYEGSKPKVVLNQGLLEPGAKFASGNVVLWVFSLERDAQSVYKQRTELIQRNVDKDVEFKNPQLGNQAFLAPGKGKVFILNQLVFSRCKAVVEIQLGDNTHLDWIANYATRLDQRLQPSVCP